MIKNQKRWIALLLILTFAWLLQVSAMPLAAADKTEQVGQAKVEREPGFFEQQGREWDRGRKKNAALIIVAGFLAISLLWLLIHGIPIDAAPGMARSTSEANRGGSR